MRGRSLALGLLLGTAADAVLADPRRLHPVAGFGSFASALERGLYRDSRSAGVAYTAACVAPVVALGLFAPGTRGKQARSPLIAGANMASVAVATWAVLGAESLRREGLALHGLLESDDLPGARQRLTHLVARDTSALSADEIARAGVESLAENTSDAVVAPLFWGAVAGVPGLLGYRAINTLDAMVGYRSERYRNFGWASARLDDAANYVPSRIAAALTAAVAPAVGGSPRAAVTTALADAPQHPSPNAGWPEAAFAGALGVQLGGVNTYVSGTESRALMGTGRRPEPGDLPRAARLSRAVTVLAAVGAAGVSLINRGKPSNNRGKALLIKNGGRRA